MTQRRFWVKRPPKPRTYLYVVIIDGKSAARIGTADELRADVERGQVLALSHGRWVEIIL